MAATDLVPCFYTGQDYLIERPSALHLRSKVREFKARNLGKFVAHGRIFLFFKRLAKTLWDGPLGVGNALPFSRQSDGSRLHYEIPHAGDIGLWRHYKKFIRVSARPQSHLAAQFIRRTQLNAPALADAFPR